MDLDLKHLGQTLAIGGFAIYGIVYLARTIWPSKIPSFLSLPNGSLQIQHSAVYLALVLATGVILEDVSKNYTSDPKIGKTSAFFNMLDKDRELRFNSLFQVMGKHATAQPICEELQKIQARNHTVEAHLKVIRGLKPDHEKRIQIGDKAFSDDLKKATNGVFYDAKNLVFQKPTYFSELSEIESRLDFTRSLTFLCIIFAGAYGLTWAASFIPRVKKTNRINNSERRIIGTLALAYLFGIWMVGTAYRSESTNFNRRVFGYYISLISKPYPEGSGTPVATTPATDD